MPIQPKPRNEREAIEQQLKDRESYLCQYIDIKLRELIENNPNANAYIIRMQIKVYYIELYKLLTQYYNKWDWKITNQGAIFKPLFRIEFWYKD